MKQNGNGLIDRPNQWLPEASGWGMGKIGEGY